MSTSMGLANARALANNENPQTVTVKKIKYTYDAAGNIEKREVILVTIPSKSGSTSKETGKEKNNAGGTSMTKSTVSGKGETNVAAAEIPDFFPEKKITVYPNPTRGMLRIDITGYDIPQDARIYIFNVQGAMIRQLTGVSATNELDISEQPAGAYIMRVVMDKENVSVSKIIKE